jgi:hypothetical protein
LLCWDGPKSKAVNFVISNPPKKELILLGLISKHFQSFASNDTIEKYMHYYHKYYEETCSIRRDHIEYRKGYSFIDDYLDEHRDDLLARIIVEPKYNKQEIILYKPTLIVVKNIEKKWKKE